KAAGSGWKSLGRWVWEAAPPPAPVNRAPTAVSVAPMETRSQSGQFRTVKTVYADLDGAADLRTVMVLVSGTTNGQNSLYAAYSTSSNKVYLRRADNSDWMPGAVLGSATVLDNGYGKLDVTQTTVSRSGNTLTVNWVAAFTSSSTGTRSVYLRALDQKGAGSGWTALGRWVWEAAVDDRNRSHKCGPHSAGRCKQRR
ncbi:MAG: hypothetical protein WKH64_08570, partial [Chloroflexia bacterium]